MNGRYIYLFKWIVCIIFLCQKKTLTILRDLFNWSFYIIIVIIKHIVGINSFLNCSCESIFSFYKFLLQQNCLMIYSENFSQSHIQIHVQYTLYYLFARLLYIYIMIKLGEILIKTISSFQLFPLTKTINYLSMYSNNH